MILRFTVFGTPVPQGSTRAFLPKGAKHPIITTDNKNLKPWRQQVAGCALEAANQAGFARLDSGPVAVRLGFYFERPAAVKKTVDMKTKRPDVDKLARGILDALTGIAFRDDAQVAVLLSSKRYDSPARAEIEVWAL